MTKKEEKKKGKYGCTDNTFMPTNKISKSFFSAKMKTGVGVGVARRGGHDTLGKPDPCVRVVLPVATPAATPPPSSAGAVTHC